uniref:RPOL4c domain-containing protein n=1 Tax=Ascaris lumbricoides TaxID=6252 RepID=A0A0M3HGQ3_ASCLU
MSKKDGKEDLDEVVEMSSRRFDVVELATFPREVVEEARKIATKLRSESDATSIIGDDSRHDRNLLRLVNKLRSVLPILEASKKDACAKYFINLREKA